MTWLSSNVRSLFVAALAAAFTAALIVVPSTETPYEVDLGSVVEVWGDVLRDVDQVGFSLTRLSAEKEMEIGRAVARRMTESARSVDPKLQAYLGRVGGSMIPFVQRKRIQYHFHVLHTETVNAYATLGGHVYVTTGMLDFVDSEAELATVIGHEISHIDLKHCVHQMQYQHATGKIVGEDLAVLVGLAHRVVEVGFSEQQELESDTGGTLLAASAGYDPASAVAVFGRLGRLRSSHARAKPRTAVDELGRAAWEALREYFATHPPERQRLEVLDRLFRRNDAVWSGRRYYVGRSNLIDRASRFDSERPNEWVVFVRPDIELQALPEQDVTNGQRRTHTGGEDGTSSTEPPGTEGAASDEQKPRVVPMSTWMAVSTPASVRSRPNGASAWIGSLRLGERVQVSGRVIESDWYRVHWHGRDGYVHGQSLVPATDESFDIIDAEARLWPQARSQVRSWPSESGISLGRLRLGGAVEITGTVKERAWYRIRWLGREGFVTHTSFGAEAGDTLKVQNDDGDSYEVLMLDEWKIVSKMSRLRIHTRPSHDSPPGVQLEPGVKIHVTGRVDGRPWYRVEHFGRSGFVPSV